MRSGIESLRGGDAEIRLRLRNELLQAVAGRGTSGAISDHLSNLGLRARMNTTAGTAAVVGLHEAWVDHAIVSRGHTHATLALLHQVFLNVFQLMGRRIDVLRNKRGIGRELLPHLLLLCQEIVPRHNTL